MPSQPLPSSPYGHTFGYRRFSAASRLSDARGSDKGELAVEEGVGSDHEREQDALLLRRPPGGSGKETWRYSAHDSSNTRGGAEDEVIEDETRSDEREDESAAPTPGEMMTPISSRTDVEAEGMGGRSRGRGRRGIEEDDEGHANKKRRGESS